MPIEGTGDRTIAVYVAETKPVGSRLLKFLFLPQGAHPAYLVPVPS